MNDDVGKFLQIAFAPGTDCSKLLHHVAGLTLGHRNAELWNEVFFFHFRGGKVSSDGDIQDNLAALEVKLFDKNAIYFYNFR